MGHVNKNLGASHPPWQYTGSSDGRKSKNRTFSREICTQSEVWSWLETQEHFTHRFWPKPEGKETGAKNEEVNGKCEQIIFNLKFCGTKVQFCIKQRTKQYIWRVLFAFVSHCPDLLLLWFCTTCLLSRFVYLFQYCTGLFRWLSQHDRLSYLSGFICW